MLYVLNWNFKEYILGFIVSDKSLNSCENDNDCLNTKENERNLIIFYYLSVAFLQRQYRDTEELPHLTYRTVFF